jgi:hypothetical protein
MQILNKKNRVTVRSAKSANHACWQRRLAVGLADVAGRVLGPSISAETVRPSASLSLRRQRALARLPEG